MQKEVRNIFEEETKFGQTNFGEEWLRPLELTPDEFYSDRTVAGVVTSNNENIQ